VSRDVLVDPYVTDVSQPEDQVLPPPEVLVRPDGVTHRIYPAPSPTAAALNVDMGWAEYDGPPIHQVRTSVEAQGYGLLNSAAAPQPDRTGNRSPHPRHYEVERTPALDGSAFSTPDLGMLPTPHSRGSSVGWNVTVKNVQHDDDNDDTKRSGDNSIVSRGLEVAPHQSAEEPAAPKSYIPWTGGVV
jgi:hypothetical protein